MDARVFISYSRKDGTGFAAELREALLTESLSVWQDIVALEGGQDWWSQIEEVLRSKVLQHFVLVVTAGSVASPVVRREIRLARQEGKTVSPVKGRDLGDLAKLPRWLGQVYDLDLPEHRTALIRVLQDQSRQKRVAMMAPEPPFDFVQRPTEFEALKRNLLDAKGDAVAISAAFNGAGGYGKTTLARALAHDPDIQDAYFDGVLWVELGEKPENLLGTISDLVTRLVGAPPGLKTINAAASALSEGLGDRRILIIIDDVWREQDLRPFLQGGPNSTRLITTRIDSVLPINAVRQPVDAMEEDEALKLLASGLPDDQVAIQRLELGKLAARLGEWALLLRLVNGFLRDRVLKSRQPLPQALLGVNHGLDKKGLVAFDARNETDRTKAVRRTIGVSLEFLNHGQRARFNELGVFPEDTDVPVSIVARLWAASGGLDAFDTEALLSELYGLSLLLSLDLDRRTVRLHDVIRRLLQEQAGDEGLVAQHKRLLNALDDIGGANVVEAATRRYCYVYTPYHLAEARDRERLDALLLDPGWLQAKLDVTRAPQELLADYDRYAVGDAQSLIGRALRLAAGICARDPRQLIPQLLGRLMTHETVRATGFLDGARLCLQRPALLMLRPSLTPPGNEIARLEGHGLGVTALCSLPDGRLASGSSDKTIRLWDLKHGIETARLEGHSNGVTALSVLPDGRLASGSRDSTIRLWDLKDATETARLKGHSNAITALCLLPNGRLASGSSDKTIRLWDLKLGIETARLEGHSNGVTALSVLPDGRLASGSRDNTIRLWDLKDGTETERLKGHSNAVTALCLLPDGQLASGSSDNTIRLWDLKDGTETARLKGHSNEVTALCSLPDGRPASASFDDSIHLWDVKHSTETTRLGGHSFGVTALCLLPSGQLASGSWIFIRLWNLKYGTEATREQHSGWVNALCSLPDGRFASASSDKTIRLWDLKHGTETACIEGHSDDVTALCSLPNGRLASGSSDKTIRLWDLKLGIETARLEGHSNGVTALSVLPDGRLASGSCDNTIRLWDLKDGTETERLKGHSNAVTALCLLPDGRLASSSSDKTIRLWDIKHGTETAYKEGLSSTVTAMCLLPDGRLASGSSDSTIRLWDLKHGTETACIEGHEGRVTALCVLPDGQLASTSFDFTIRLWETATQKEFARIEADSSITCSIALADGRLVVGDTFGRLHWLGIVD